MAVSPNKYLCFNKQNHRVQYSKHVCEVFIEDNDSFNIFAVGISLKKVFQKISISKAASLLTVPISSPCFRLTSAPFWPNSVFPCVVIHICLKHCQMRMVALDTHFVSDFTRCKATLTQTCFSTHSITKIPLPQSHCESL